MRVFALSFLSFLSFLFLFGVRPTVAASIEAPVMFGVTSIEARDIVQNCNSCPDKLDHLYFVMLGYRMVFDDPRSFRVEVKRTGVTKMKDKFLLAPNFVDYLQKFKPHFAGMLISGLPFPKPESEQPGFVGLITIALEERDTDGDVDTYERVVREVFEPTLRRFFADHVAQKRLRPSEMKDIPRIAAKLHRALEANFEIDPGQVLQLISAEFGDPDHLIGGAHAMVTAFFDEETAGRVRMANNFKELEVLDVEDIGKVEFGEYLYEMKRTETRFPPINPLVEKFTSNYMIGLKLMALE